MKSKVTSKQVSQVSLNLTEFDPYTSRKSPTFQIPNSQSVRTQLPPLGMKLGKVDWSEIMKRHSEHSSSAEPEPVRSSFFCDKAMEEAKTDLSRLYYNESETLEKFRHSPLQARRHRKLKAASVSTSYDEKQGYQSQEPSHGIRRNSGIRLGLTEVVDDVEVKSFQIRRANQGMVGLEMELKVISEGVEKVEKLMEGTKSEKVTVLKRLLENYKQLTVASLTFCKQETTTRLTVKKTYQVKQEVSPEAPKFDPVEHILRQQEAKRKLEELEQYINADSEAYEKLKTSMLALLQTTSAGTMEYLRKLHQEMSKVRSMPQDMTLEFPAMRLNEWEGELKSRFRCFPHREMQKLTARKILQLFERKVETTDDGEQTDLEYVDTHRFVTLQQQHSILEAEYKELRDKVSELESELYVKNRVAVKLQTDIDSEKKGKEAAVKDLAKLREEHEMLARMYTTEKKELLENTSKLESKKVLIKSLKQSTEEMKAKIEQMQYIIDWFETNQQTAYDQEKEVRKELRVLYKQYFQPKMLSKMSHGHADNRRRSISVLAFAEKPSKPSKPVRRSKSAQTQKRPMEMTLGFHLEEAKTGLEAVESAADQEGLEIVESTADQEGLEIVESAADQDGMEAIESIEDQEDPQFTQMPLDEESQSSVLPKDYPQTRNLGDLTLQEDAESDVERKGRDRNETMDSATTKRVDPSVTSSIRGRVSQGSLETEVRESIASKISEGKYGEESQRYAGKTNRQGKDHQEDPDISSSRVHRKDSYPDSSTSLQRSLLEISDRATRKYSDSSIDRPSSHYIPSVQAESISLLGPNDKVVMTDSELSWEVVIHNSVGVQYNYLNPEVSYEPEENAVVGSDGVKYYMWPLNPNQLYGLSGDVFYHTVLKAFQAMPRIPLSKTGEPHQPPYVLSDTVTGKRVTGETKLSPHKPRQADHSPSCGENCKHLRRRVGPGKKEQLLPIAKQDLRYQFHHS